MDIRKALLKPKLKTETVHLPRLDIDVTVMEMNADRLEKYESLIYSADQSGKISADSDHIKAKIAVYSVVDDQGELIFKPEDVDQLSQSYGKDISVIAAAGARLSQLFEAEEVEKNSDPDRG